MFPFFTCHDSLASDWLASYLLVAGLGLACGLQPLPEGEEEVPHCDVNTTYILLTELEDLPPCQTKLTNTFTDLLQHLPQLVDVRIIVAQFILFDPFKSVLNSEGVCGYVWTTAFCCLHLLRLFDHVL